MYNKQEKAIFQKEGKFLRYQKELPSFSSSLLDKIYRSIDDDRDARKACNGSDESRFFREKKQSIGRASTKVEEREEEEELASFRRACLIEKWMDKKIGERVVSHSQTTRRQYRHYSESEAKFNDALFSSSTSSSSDSSSGGFSSSDTESMFGAARPKPVRTSLSDKRQPRNVSCYKLQGSRIASDEEETALKSKSRALKIYNNLKKVKQPISPGGKLATFLNSLFSPKPSAAASAAGGGGGGETPAAATCSSASSLSRSCLSKSSTSSARGMKRSVRFYPVSVVVDEDSRPCGHISLYGDRKPAAKSDTTREFLRDFRQNQKMVNELMIIRDRKELLRKEVTNVVHNHNNVDDNDDDDMDDSASYSSSDLFELDHLAVIDKEVRYQEELPVYETTRVHRNRAIF